MTTLTNMCKYTLCADRFDYKENIMDFVNLHKVYIFNRECLLVLKMLIKSENSLNIGKTAASTAAADLVIFYL